MNIALKTNVEGIDWPMLAAPDASDRLAVLFQLEQSQWWSEDKLRAMQFAQIDLLLQHSIKHVPYYRKILDHNLALQPLTENQWQKIPLLTRETLQLAGNDLIAKKMPAGHGGVAITRTSGSTGTPVETLVTDITQFFWNVFTLRDHLWQRRNFSHKLAVIRLMHSKDGSPPVPYHARNWGAATTGVYDTGICAMMNIHTPISEQIAWLQKEQPDCLLTHPSVLQELALHCQRNAIKLPSLKEVRTISEALPDGLRALCKEVWGVKLTDVYSTIELGNLAFQCPEHEHYHIQSEGVLLEILDENGQACKPGQVGKVVVTNLHNFASPLIRYELGDYAEVGELCSCGRGLPVIKRILGRYRNLVVLPNGERRWPKFAIGKVLEIAAVRQFQAIQHTVNKVEFLLVMGSPLTDDSRQKLQTLFQRNLHSEINISISEVDEIPRSASGKYEEFVSRL